MPKSPWAKLWGMWNQPIDWQAVALQIKGPTRRGDKRAKWELERQRQGQAARRRRLQAAALERSVAARRGQRKALPRGAAQAAILAALDGWKTRAEIRRATGLNYDTIKGAMPVMLRKGLIEQREIEARGTPQWIEPVARYEFALTAQGRAVRAWLEAQTQNAQG